ncbi:MAG TPA: hypothetical protein VF843_08110 [Streptosporangiaceae bacterium]
MAGPWTISRDRAEGKAGQDVRAWLGRVRAPAVPLVGPAARKPEAGSATPGSPSTGARNTGGRALPWWAVPVLTLLAVAAVVLAWATISLGQYGVSAAQAAASISGGPLVSPAPRSAGNLPRRFDVTIDPADQQIVTQLEQKFAAVTAQLLAGAARGAATGARVTAIRPAGLYGEPGHLDPLTSRPSWVMYLGLQSSARFGSPADTISSLMMGILGKYSKIGPWPVAAGHRGGQANCTVAWLGGTETSVCGWATGNTIGVVASPTRETSVGELAMLLIQMRWDLQRSAS